MSCTKDDVLDVLELLASARLKKAPRPEQAVRVYWGVLQNQPHHLMEAAAYRWMQDPDQGRWFPSAPDLLDKCLAIEAEQRENQKTEAGKDGGCAACGRIRHPDGPAYSQGGTGWRYVIQHCYPCTIHGVGGCESCAAQGEIDWGAEPYRVGVRKILCDCALGADRRMGHSLVEGGQAPASVEDVWHRYGRADCRLYVTGTEHRMIADDTRVGSPFYSHPGPEETAETAADLLHAAQQRQLAYSAIRGQIPGHLAAYMMKYINASRAVTAKKQVRAPSWLRVGGAA